MNKNLLYTLLAVLVVVGGIVTYGFASNYEPQEGGYNPDAVVVGLVWGFAIQSIVLLVLLFTLRSAAATVKHAAQVTRLKDEKDHVIIIEGIGEAYAARLNQNGIITISQLMDSSPEDVAAKVGVTSALVREWQAAGQLIQVKGIGPQYAEILVMAGITTIGALAQSDPVALTSRIDAIEESRKVRVVGTNITQKHVERWIKAAKDYLASH